MSIAAYVETTQWKDGATPNHVYLFSGGDRVMGYVPAGKTKAVVFKAPIMIDKRGRTFKKLDNYTCGDGAVDTAPADPDEREVTGSKGEVYIVNDREHSCTCPGFKFRGKCRHIDSV